MPTFAVCTALYEAARPFLPAYLAGLRAAAQGEDLILVTAVDDLCAPEDVIAQLETICPVAVVKAPGGATPARVRKSLLLEATASAAEILVFADMDDVLAADAPGKHRDALQDADVSFGDLRIIDAAGHDTKRRYFDGADVPWSLSTSGPLLDRNFLGLSNTAVRKASIPDTALAVPDNIRAVDWWFFTTLLLAGRTARRVPTQVADYRIYGDNELGAGVPKTREDLRNLIDIAERHYGAFPAIADFSIRRHRLATLSDEVAGWSSHELAVALSAPAATPGVWFESLSRLCHPQTSMAAIPAVA